MMSSSTTSSSSSSASSSSTTTMLLSLSSWKHRLYAFLLRRLLEPILDDDSLRRLHDSIIEISISDGRFIMTNMNMRTQYIQKRFFDDNKTNNTGSSMKVTLARIDKLIICLSLEETSSSSKTTSSNTTTTSTTRNDDGNSNLDQTTSGTKTDVTDADADGDNTTNNDDGSSLVWRAAMQLSSTATATVAAAASTAATAAAVAATATATAAATATTTSSETGEGNYGSSRSRSNNTGSSLTLLAAVEIDGLYIQLEAIDDDSSCQDDNDNDPKQRNDVSQQHNRGVSKANHHNDHNNSHEQHGIGTAAAQHDDDDGGDVVGDKTTSSSSTSSSYMTSMISSYVEAALASLRLSVQLTNFRIRIYNHGGGKRPTTTRKTRQRQQQQRQRRRRKRSWMELRLHKVNYHDVKDQQQQQQQRQRRHPSQAHISTRQQERPQTTTTMTTTTGTTSSSSTLYETIMHKAIDLNRITLVAGCDDDNSDKDNAENDYHEDDAAVPCAQKQQQQQQQRPRPKDTITVGLLEGTSYIRFRAIEYHSTRRRQQQQQQQPLRTSLSQQQPQEPQQKKPPPRIQQDVEITINQKLSMSFDRMSLAQIRDILGCLSSGKPPKSMKSMEASADSTTASSSSDAPVETTTTTLSAVAPVAERVADVKTMDGIMKQYEEARLLAEHNQVRGGILVPSTLFSPSSSTTGTAHHHDPRLRTNPLTRGMEAGSILAGEITFDAFFDANEGSFHRYSTMMNRSSIHDDYDDVDDDNDGAAGKDTTKMKKGNKGGGGGDWVHTKIRLHLEQGMAKLVFNSNEYMLLTFSDLNMSSSVSIWESDHSLNVTHVEIEDSQKVKIAVGAQDDNNNDNVRIGSLVRFSHLPDDMYVARHDDDDDDDDEGQHRADDDGSSSGVLIQAPNLSLHVKTRRIHNKKKKNKRVSLEDNDINRDSTMDVELALEPLELTYHPRTIVHLMDTLRAISVEEDEAKSETRTTTGIKKEGKTDLKFYASCPSMNVNWPFIVDGDEEEQHVDWSNLFDRAGHVCGGLPSIERSSFGMMFDTVSFELNPAPATTAGTTTTTTTRFCCHHIFPYATHRGGGVGSRLTRKARRVDILGLCGRTEVNPSIPVVVELIRCGVDNHGDADQTCNNNDDDARKADAVHFPMVPAISSFKARQQDEDEDLRIDRVLTSRLRNDLTFGTRRELRGVDPQSSMIENAIKSDVVVKVHVPEFVVDLTPREIVALKEMLDCALLKTAGRHEDEQQQKQAQEEMDPVKPSSWVGVAVKCDFICLTLHLDEELCGQDDDAFGPYAYTLRMEHLKTHALTEGGSLRHIRLLTREMDFLEMADLARPTSTRSPASGKERRDLLLQRGQGDAVSSATPLFHRSHLFAPISRESPVVLLDVVVPAAAGVDGLAKRNVHFTVYDLTYRYDPDSRWISRLKSLLPKREESKQEQEQIDPTDSSASTLTKLFVSASDCNFDYSSSSRFEHASRTIVRCGDFRVSSNLPWPAAPVQTFSVSLGDLSLYLCNQRFSYNFENSQLIRSETLLHTNQISLDSLSKLVTNTTSDAVLRAMNYRTIVMLDSTDAVVAFSNVKPKTPSDPFVQASFTVGELGVFACKDSFSLFSSTLGELSTELTSLDEEAFLRLKSKSPCEAEGDTLSGSKSDAASHGAGDDDDKDRKVYPKLDELRRQSALRPAAGTLNHHSDVDDFLLDGYDWTTIDVDTSSLPIPPGEEQVSRWYGSEETDCAEDSKQVGIVAGVGKPIPGTIPQQEHAGPRIITHHFPMHPVSDPVGDGDMDMAKYAGTDTEPQVQTRVLVHDIAIKLRFFDGYDWPELLDPRKRSPPADGAYIINEMNPDNEQEEHEEDVAQDVVQDKKTSLMGNLLEGAPDNTNTFQSVPLPEERGNRMKEQAMLRKLARRSSKYVQIAASGVCLRLDSVKESADYRLKSCFNLSARDFFLAETISTERPVKMIGEWLNDIEHPRDTKDGLLMMKMVTWNPRSFITLENCVASDDAEVALKILPLRCLIDQRAVRFTKSFFQSESRVDQGSPPPGLSRTGLHVIPPPIFRMFRVQPYKLKVDYTPQIMNSKALRDGALVELINLSPLDGLVLTLKMVECVDETGFGAAISVVVRRWIQDICSTQLIKFLTNSRPLEPITHVGGSAADLIVLPWEAFKNGGSTQKALRAGAASFTNAVAYEALTMTSRATEYVASQVARASSAGGRGAAVDSVLPSRPLEIPRGLTDATPHAVESLARGLQAANYKVVVVPYREYRRSGATGAARSVLRGIPVAIAAPASGAAEAISFALLGARNQLRPDIRKEEEASLRGLHFDG